MKHRVAPIHFDQNRHAAFQQALRDRVRAYLDQQPNDRFANGFMWFKVAFYLVAFVGVWASLAFTKHSVPVSLVLIMVFACLVVGVAYNISHDAVHGAISRKKWVNELLFHTFTLLGPNGYIWRYRHKVVHHDCVNIAGRDYNIEASDLLRFSPTQTWRPVHRWQHLYAPILYLVFTTHWVFVKDFQMLREKRIGNLEDIEHQPAAVVSIAFWKLFYIGYMLVVPMLFSGWRWWQVLLGYAFYQAFVSFQFVITFTGSHLNEGLFFLNPGEGDAVPHSFLEHQLHTTCDFNPTHPVVSFWLGGFNAHVAHHMFPTVCSVHYPALTRIIERTCAEYDMPYKQMPMHQLYLRHFKYLKQLGASAEGPRAAYMLPDAS